MHCDPTFCLVRLQRLYKSSLSDWFGITFYQCLLQRSNMAQNTTPELKLHTYFSTHSNRTKLNFSAQSAEVGRTKLIMHHSNRRLTERSQVNLPHPIVQVGGKNPVNNRKARRFSNMLLAQLRCLLSGLHTIHWKEKRHNPLPFIPQRGTWCSSHTTIAWLL